MMMALAIVDDISVRWIEEWIGKDIIVTQRRDITKVSYTHCDAKELTPVCF